MYKLLIVSWLFLLLAAPLQAQTQWFNPLEDGHAHYIQNQAWDEDGGNYNRLPARAKGKVRDDVWNLSRESAGLSIRFLTDSKKIQVRYQVTGGYSMPHMPATGVSGVDLYAKVGGKSLVCYGSYSFADTIRYNYTIDKDISSDAKKEYELYLPLYNGVKWLEIGVEEGKELAFIPARKDRCVLVYGTSIAQGACASRPGMAWTNIVSRELDVPVVNLGFSGNGRLEKEVIDFICEVNAWAYVIDCMANLQDRPAEEVKTLAIKAVKRDQGLCPAFGKADILPDALERYVQFFTDLLIHFVAFSYVIMFFRAFGKVNPGMDFAVVAPRSLQREVGFLFDQKHV